MTPLLLRSAELHGERRKRGEGHSPVRCGAGMRAVSTWLSTAPSYPDKPSGHRADNAPHREKN